VQSGVRAVADVVETILGNICCTSCAIKPNCVIEDFKELFQLKYTGVSPTMAESELVALSGSIFFFRRLSES